MITAVRAKKELKEVKQRQRAQSNKDDEALKKQKTDNDYYKTELKILEVSW